MNGEYGLRRQLSFLPHQFHSIHSLHPGSFPRAFLYSVCEWLSSFAGMNPPSGPVCSFGSWECVCAFFGCLCRYLTS